MAERLLCNDSGYPSNVWDASCAAALPKRKPHGGLSTQDQAGTQAADAATPLASSNVTPPWTPSALFQNVRAEQRPAADVTYHVSVNALVFDLDQLNKVMLVKCSRYDSESSRYTRALNVSGNTIPVYQGSEDAEPIAEVAQH